MSKVTWMYRDDAWNWSTAGVPVFDSQADAEGWISDHPLPHARLVDAG